MNSKFLKIVGKYIILGVVFLSSGLNVFANTSSILTYDEAFSIALKNNRNIVKITDTLDNIDELLTKPTNTPAQAINANPYLSAQVTKNYFKLANASTTTKLTFEALVDALELQLRASFININSLKDNIAFKEKKLIEMQKKYGDLGLKYRNGMASKYEYDQYNFSIDKLQEELSENKLSLKKEYDNLRSIMGIRSLDSDIEKIEFDYLLVDSLELSPDYQAAKAVSDSPSIIAQQKAIEESELALTVLPLELYGVANSNLFYEITPINVQKSELKLKDTELRNAKDQLYFNVVESYNTMKTLENNIAKLEIQLNTLNQNIKLMELRLNAGMITQRDLSDLILSKEELEITIENLKANHSILIMQYQKPHLFGLN